ncbi:MAG TPA: 4-hydroxy-tetrahydrodipicolinate reductase [Bacteroidia bacterium]|jgi:4-hydroxy-tetrahydrodipicolinate reductase|nr:4-hydroxy-tetrahydrodipicolinate reductase [Bacteroidia bacterium]
MNIALIGYGKMGKEIEQIALSRGHKIALIVDAHNATTYTLDELKKADVAIEFSTPDSALGNIYKCFEAGVPIVVGTTGWLDKLEEVKKKCTDKKQTLFYTSNYSIGVNLFFKLNQQLAKLMNNHKEYNVHMEEIHHVHKLDSPSGTAISLANQVIANVDEKKKWVNATTADRNELGIVSKRLDEVPGTHTVTYASSIDEISITHIAHNRKGFALGAVVAAEWVHDKKGVFGMEQLMSDI